MKKNSSILACFLIFGICQAQDESFKYLNQPVPNDTPKIFMKGVAERIAISNDFKEIYFNDGNGVKLL